MLALLAPLLACAPADGDAPTDDSAAGDSGTTTDFGFPIIGGLDDSLLAPPEGLWQADWFTVPRDRGLVWQRDDDWRLEGYTVPQIFVRPDGTLVMLATKMDDPEGRWTLTSSDGVHWDPADAPIFKPEDFEPMDCGNRLEDGAVMYQEDGSYHLILEGSLLDEETDTTAWRHWCHAVAQDGTAYEPVTESYFFLGGPNDNDLPSVPSFLMLSDWSALLYYVGNLNYEQNDQGIRAAHVTYPDQMIEYLAPDSILPSDDVDPMPVYLEGGGVRLYHTHSSGGGPGYTDLADGMTVEGDAALIDNEGGDCFTPGGECLLDPAFVRLPDGTMYLYYTWVIGMEGGDLDTGIGRAIAVD